MKKISLISCFFLFFFLVTSVALKAQGTGLDLEKQAIQEAEKGNQVIALDLFSKAGYAYWSDGKTEKAIPVFSKALQYAAELNNRNALIALNNNLALLYTGKEDYRNALRHFQSAYELIRQLRTSKEQAEALMNIASAQEGLQEYEQAIKTAQEAMQIAQEEQDLRLMRKGCGLLASCYEKLGKSELAFQYFGQFTALDREIKAMEYQSIRKEAQEKVAVAEQELSKTAGLLKETSDSLAVVARLAQLQKLEIELRTSQLREKEAQLKYEQYIRRSMFIGAAGILLFLLLVSMMLVLKVRDNKRLREQKKKIEEQNHHIQRQNELLDIQNRNIKDSIHYARTIQKAILPSEDEINKMCVSAVLFLPKDIVSGDFYWFSLRGNEAVFAVADCTGHGVPGAFMSMIGSMLLNEIVNKQGIIDPPEILNVLDQRLIYALHQETYENTDGMDIAVLKASKSDSNVWNISFSGARRPVIYSSAGAYQIIEGDKISLGGNRIKSGQKRFTPHHLILQQDDELVLYTDGLTDQPDNNRKKFGLVRFQEFLTGHRKLPPEEKIEKLRNELEQFTDQPQRDDITVWIIKLS
ncbi:MAG: SpoIIE family protein phosphatase [Bacteroidales bacterium]